jgi:hypothetical protein
MHYIDNKYNAEAIAIDRPVILMLAKNLFLAR